MGYKEIPLIARVSMKTLICQNRRLLNVARTPFVRQDNLEVSPLDPETQQSIDQSKHLLRQISEDSSVPRNIRRAANEAIAVLETETDSPAVRAQNAISILDEPSQDPNCPNHARTKIWHVSSLLEPIRD